MSLGPGWHAGGMQRRIVEGEPGSLPWAQWQLWMWLTRHLRRRPLPRLRATTGADAAFLAAMLDAAGNWRPGAPHQHVPAHYIAGWPKEGDYGVVAEAGRPLGAAWWRFFPPDDPGYGFVDATIPEITIAVVQDARGRGIGTHMMEALIDEARCQKLTGLSLSVEPDNYARRLYERLGFQPVGETVGAVTMLLPLDSRTTRARPPE